MRRISTTALRRTCAAVIDFYNTRFSLNFTDQDKADLVAFLKTL